MKNILKNDEFEALFLKVKEEIKPILEADEESKKENLRVDDIIMWQSLQNGEYLVFPSEKCPKQIKEEVLSVILKNNPKPQK